MQNLSPEEKQQALQAIIEKMKQNQDSEAIPMESAPIEEMTPEKAQELDSIQQEPMLDKDSRMAKIKALFSKK
jgi:transposase-like protein